MSRDPADNNQHLPPWLRGLPLPSRPAGTPAPSSADPTPATWNEDASIPNQEDQAVPDWLQALGGATDAQSPAPDAQAARNDEPSEALSSDQSDDALPDWLRDLRAESAPPTEEAASSPDWMHSTANESEALEIRESAESEETVLPDWLRGDSSASEEVDSSASGESLPSWLAGLAADESPAAPSDEASERAALPEPTETHIWDAAPSSSLPEASQSDQQVDADIPAWLRDIPSDEIRRVMEGEEENLEEDLAIEPFSFGEPSERAAETPSADAPAWLSDISGTEGTETDTGPAWLGGLDDTPSAPAESASVPDLPLWLQDLGEASAESPPTEPAAAEPAQPETEALPAWLDQAAQAQPSAGGSPPELEESSPTQSPAEDLPAWLQSGTPAAAEQEQPNVSPPPENLPAWLRSDTPSAPAENLPAWLQSDAPTTGQEERSELAEPAQENLPAWLRADAPTESPAAPQEGGVPDWLHANAPPSPAPTEVQELPPWLSDAITSTPAPEPAHTPPPDPSWHSAPAASPDEELPAWLRDDAPAPPAEEVPPWLQTSNPPEVTRSDAPPPAAEDLPPWLRDDEGQPLPTAGRPGDANLPEWLRGEDAYSTDQSAVEQSAAPSASGQPPAAPNLDWFEEDTNTRTAEQPSAPEGGFFGGAELPAWLRKADTEPTTEISSADARSLDWLTKLGSYEEEVAGVAVTPTARSVPLPPAPIRSEAQMRAITLLQNLAADPYPISAPAAAPPAPRFWQRFGLERLLYVVLLVALLAALTVPDLGASLQAPPQAPGAEALFARIDTLTAQDVVLIGYEWDARRISELKPLEQAVIGQLIQKQVKLVLVSTDPQGTLLLFDLRDDLQLANYQEGGEDYILLGYKPGGDFALRAMAQDFQAALRSDFQGGDATISALAGGLQTGKPLLALSDFSMMVVLADEAGDVQSWVEQIYRSVPQTPLAFLLPAESVPLVEPYLQPPRDARVSPIYHLAGKQGALAYEQLRGAQRTADVQIERESGQQRLAILVFVALLLVGGLLVGISRALRRGDT